MDIEEARSIMNDTSDRTPAEIEEAINRLLSESECTCKSTKSFEEKITEEMTERINSLPFDKQKLVKDAAYNLFNPDFISRATMPKSYPSPIIHPVKITYVRPNGEEVFFGLYESAKVFAEQMGIDVESDSVNRVLKKYGFLVKPSEE